MSRLAPPLPLRPARFHPPSSDRRKRGPRTVTALALLAALATAVIAPSDVAHAASRPHVSTGQPTSRGHCPWIAQARTGVVGPGALAGEVLSHMTLTQKADYLSLATHGPVENANQALPALCLPSVSLSDGPNGLGNGLTGVTQFPAAIGVAATFDPAIARAIGRAEALEARAKGIMAVQGPELNLARVPLSGRIFEAYGEDPYLTSVMGVADVLGIQSTGELADAKHFTAYTQENARARINQVVTPRVLAEIYDAPFKAVVQQGHVASLMCSYGSLNGVNTCSDPLLYRLLASWGFTGFVRSDLRAVHSVPAALRAGISLMKPLSTTSLVHLVRRGLVPVRDVNRAVRNVLTVLFAHHLITRVPQPHLTSIVTSPSHAAIALRAAEASIVLLKDQRGILPLSAHVSSLAVIGTDASSQPVSAGLGSAYVKPPYVTTPLAALRAALPASTTLRYQPGGPSSLDLDTLSNVAIVAGTPLALVTRIHHHGEPGKSDIGIELDPSVTPATATAAVPGHGRGWQNWRLTVRAQRTGVYELTIQQFGDLWLSLNGHLILASRGLHARADMATAVSLVAGRRYTFDANWFNVRDHPQPSFGIEDVTPQINAAVAIARRSRVAIVFAGDLISEGIDRPNLQLPGDANALISAVARANPHTIVVLNTGSAVLMPWLARVAAVVEAWYPGQVDGTAVTRVLTGAVDPSGRLPLTFPASATAAPATSPSQYPGIDGTVNLGGLDIGYRWYQAHHVAPLFAFGYGLSYTRFALADAALTRASAGRVVVRVRLTNTGTRVGSDVVQAYVHYPSAAGEPPEQLRAFRDVTLSPGASRRVSLVLPASSFQIYQGSSFVTLPGSYRVDVGSSSASLPLRLALTLTGSPG